MDALKEHPFVGSPLCRMSDGKDLVRVELTYQPIDTRIGLKAGGSHHPSAGEWPRQFAPATRPTTALPGGDDTTISVDSSRQSKTKHHTRPHAEDSNHPAIAYHHQTTSSNIYFSCQPAEEENTDAVAYSASQQKKKKKKKKKESYSLRQLRLLIPTTWEICPLQRQNDELCRRDRQKKVRETSSECHNHKP